MPKKVQKKQTKKEEKKMFKLREIIFAQNLDNFAGTSVLRSLLIVGPEHTQFYCISFLLQFITPFSTFFWQSSSVLME